MTEVTPDKETRGGEPPPSAPPPTFPSDNGWRKEYWSRNLRLMVILLAVWFVVSFGFGILLVEPLNNIAVAGFPLGFWFAQQGSIYVFVILIFVYAKMMDRLDNQFGVDEQETERAGS
ncbi:DUF4212 domain-containing protein [Micromonospora sp. HNM0581]|uniref:DUF4212 domain-containing protein n=1 Tax=Micromonospora sp. HNM0581 TaxID=2716341 RepID=UPI00146B6DD7|nr:DUF4212 domain-containing protein [Micromonospora sp. HNM0581]NLU78388.1 DUF4212 domain-containing protein [Micromonospora sp. HNM0581]